MTKTYTIPRGTTPENLLDKLAAIWREFDDERLTGRAYTIELAMKELKQLRDDAKALEQFNAGEQK